MSGVTSIGDWAFSDCTNLTSITIPGSVTSIGEYAFNGCTGLSSITIPGSVTSIGKYAFGYCDSLSSMKVDSGNSIYHSSGNCIIETASKTLVFGCNSSVIPTDGSVTSIGECAFLNCQSLVAISIPYGVTNIGSYAFGSCKSLTSINICYGVTSIDKYAFAMCTSLTSITLPVTVTTIGSSAFRWCYNLTSIAIPSSVTSIGNIAFNNCTSLTDVYYNGSERDWDQISIGTSNEYLTDATIHYTVNIVTEPADVLDYVGKTAKFTVGATGDGLTYKWIYRTSSNGTWMDCSESGCTTNTLRVVATADKSGYQYSCRVTDAYGNYEWTRDANLYVCGFTEYPSDVIVAVGSTAQFSVSAVGNDLTYQWQYRANSSGDWKDSTASGATTDTVSVKGTAAKNGYQYRCCITDANYMFATTNPVTLYVYGVTKQPSDVSVTADSTAKFKVTATGKNLTYQWQYRTSSSGSWKNSSATGYNTKNLSVKGTTGRNGYQYRCKITATYNGTTYVTYSKAATLYVFGITKQPSNTTVSAGSTAKFSVTATGKSLTYQWQYRTSKSGSWKNSTASNATTKTVSVKGTAARNGYQFRCKVSDASGNVAYTKAATLTVSSITITKQPTSATVQNGKTVKFSVTATGSGLKYQWQYRTSSSGSWKNSSATGYKTNTLSVKGTTGKHGYQYRCKITDSNGAVKYTSAVTLSVSNATITKQPSSTSVSAGSTAKFSITTTGSGLKYQWQYRTSSSGSWKNSSATGYKTKTLSVKATASKNGYQYRCKITDANGTVIYTTAATLTVK